MLLKLLCRVWEEKTVPKDWVDAILVPIPKKGDLTKCDNWRGISLLDVAGKVIARMICDRLQHLAEEVLPDSQCGFRKNRGCSDMIFTVRQLVEKAWEHKSRAFHLHIDLRKAYDSVPRAALWAVLRKIGIPESLIELIKAFHCHMKAQIRLDDCLLDEIDVEMDSDRAAVWHQFCSIYTHVPSLRDGRRSSRVKKGPEYTSDINMTSSYSEDTPEMRLQQV